MKFPDGEIFLEDPQKQEFLIKSEKLLEERLYQSAIDLARERIKFIPGDIDAKLTMGRALIGIGAREDAFKVLSNIKSSIHRWISMLSTLEDPELLIDSGELASCGQAFDKSEMDSSREQAEQETAALLEEYHTPIMADLLINQGHFESAREVLESILRINPENAAARERLKELDSHLAKKQIMPKDQRTFVLNELEKWMKKIRRTQ